MSPRRKKVDPELLVVSRNTMTFLYPLLVSGLVLAGIPVLLHLIMRQKPKHQLFPAFRFLLQRHRTNQRKLRLRHLLLLALRVLLIALLCLALARPKVFNQGIGLGGQPVAAVLLFDTSFSMEYVAGGRSRLDEARSRALELLQEFPEGSRVAVLDTTTDPSEPSGEWLSVGQARDRIEGLRLRSNNSPVTARLPDAYRLLADQDQDPSSDQPWPRFLYVFSDRTEGAWDAGRLKDLQALRDRITTGVHAAFVDVGAETPTNLAIVGVKPKRQVIAAGQELVVEATIRAVGADAVNVLKCQVGTAVDQKEVKLSAGQSQVVAFKWPRLALGFHRVEVTLGTGDALAFDNARYASAEVRGGRHVLTIADDPEDADFWKWALETLNLFRCEVVATKNADQIPNWSKYQVICLLNVAKPPPGLWAQLESHVERGGGLIVIPGGSELQDLAYNGDPIAQELMPGELKKIISTPRDKGADWHWDEGIYRHPLLRLFQDERRSDDTDYVRFPRGAENYWEVEPRSDAIVLVRYADTEKRPALLERAGKSSRGKVLLLTTKMDGDITWNNYMTMNSFFYALATRTSGYLAGDTEETNLNFNTGQLVTVPLPGRERFPTYTLRGPGVTGTQAILARREDQGELEIPQAVTPGTYHVIDPKDAVTAQFSVNIPPEESLLTRVPAEQIEELFGPDSVLPVDKKTNLREALQGRWGQPIELLPWLMILVLIALAVENLLANKFYRQESTEEGGTVSQGR